jgi:precorrin-8X/cobalt-precorrin-8 methylmutase
MITSLNHPLVEQSFAIIDQEIGPHSLSPQEYAIARRVIHATADFEFAQLLCFSPNAIASGIDSLRQGKTIITDVTMVKQGITNLVAKTFQNPIITAIEKVIVAPNGKTRSEIGILQCLADYPQSIYVIGNAPTALLALCEFLNNTNDYPSLIIGAPVGFVSVCESKQALSLVDSPQIRVEGRKGGSAVAAAILNALILLAWEKS